MAQPVTAPSLLSHRRFKVVNIILLAITAIVSISCGDGAPIEEYCPTATKAFTLVGDQVAFLQGVIDRSTGQVSDYELAGFLVPEVQILEHLADKLGKIDRPKSAKELHEAIFDLENAAYLAWSYLDDYLEDRDSDNVRQFIRHWDRVQRNHELISTDMAAYCAQTMAPQEGG